MIMRSTQGWDLIRFGYYARRALDVLATELDALPVTYIIDFTIQCKGFSIDRQHIVASSATSEAHFQMIEILFFDWLSFSCW